MLKGLIFDFDGTLADTLPLCIAAFRAASEPLLGRPVSDQEIISTFGPAEEGAVKLLVPHAPAECLEGYFHHYQSLHHLAPTPFEGVEELLSDLKDQSYFLGLVTGKGPNTLKISLNHHQLSDWFSEMRAGCEHGPCKPEKIREILDIWQIEPSTVAYIGDHPSDVRAARAAGCLAVGAAWASTAEPDLIAAMEPDVLCHTLGDFRAWIQAN